MNDLTLPTYQHEIRPLSGRQIEQLLAELNANRVSTRPQGGTKLSYVEAWDIKATLTRVFGFGGWSTKITRADILKVEPGTNNQGKPNVSVTAIVHTSLYVHQLGASWDGVAVCTQSGQVVGDVGDFAIKTADSDALKRAAIALGTQFGLSLYDNGTRSDIIKHVLADGQTASDRSLLHLEGRVNEARNEVRRLKLIEEGKQLAAEIARLNGEPNADPATGEIPDPIVAEPADLPPAPPTNDERAAAAATVAAGFKR